MSSVDVFVLAHGDGVARAPTSPPFRSVDLEVLPLPKGVPNQLWLSECVVFLGDTLLKGKAEYVWITSGRHDGKWVAQEGRTTNLMDLPKFVSADPLWCSCIASHADWEREDDEMHPGMRSAIAEMQDAFHLVNRHDTAYANSFCFPRDMMEKFLSRWREMFWHFHQKYGVNLPFSVGSYDEARKGSYFYERVSMALIADWNGITLKQIP